MQMCGSANIDTVVKVICALGATGCGERANNLTLQRGCRVSEELCSKSSVCWCHLCISLSKAS